MRRSSSAKNIGTPFFLAGFPRVSSAPNLNGSFDSIYEQRIIYPLELKIQQTWKSFEKLQAGANFLSEVLAPERYNKIQHCKKVFGEFYQGYVKKKQGNPFFAEEFSKFEEMFFPKTIKDFEKILSGKEVKFGEEVELSYALYTFNGWINKTFANAKPSTLVIKEGRFAVSDAGKVIYFCDVRDAFNDLTKVFRLQNYEGNYRQLFSQEEVFANYFNFKKDLADCLKLFLEKAAALSDNDEKLKSAIKDFRDLKDKFDQESDFSKIADIHKGIALYDGVKEAFNRINRNLVSKECRQSLSPLFLELSKINESQKQISSIFRESAIAIEVREQVEAIDQSPSAIMAPMESSQVAMSCSAMVSP